MEQHKPKWRFNFLKWVVVLGIVIVLNLFFGYALDLIYHQPQYEAFCKQEQVTIVPDSQEACVASGGAWTENAAYDTSIPYPKTVPVSVELARQPRGYCDPQFTCRKGFDSANSVYRKNIFIARVVLGVIVIGAGFLTMSAQAVSLGLSFGGVLSLIIATVSYWSELADWGRVIALGVALLALIWLGVKKIQTE